MSAEGPTWAGNFVMLFPDVELAEEIHSMSYEAFAACDEFGHFWATRRLG